MKNRPGLRLVPALLLLCAAAAAQQSLITDPETVTFNTQDQTTLVQVLRNGLPVNITSVSGHQFLVGRNTYEYMIKVTAEDGKLQIKPTNLLEVGSYLLIVNTNAGRVAMDVFAPLAEMPDSLEARAARAGVSPEQMKTLLGLSTGDPRSAVSLGLPPVYYEGQTLVLTMPPEPGRNYTWAVNGKVVREGVGENEFVYTFREPGEYLVTYAERDNGKVTASAAGTTVVRPVPAVVVELPPNTEFIARAPDGFRRYAWISNGQAIGAGREINYLPTGPGVYEIEVRAEDPVAGPYDQFLRTRYHVVVK
ncbi:MAG: hypothetical protein NTZ09_12370 [Candidatus Hydrogenedentes bacterium]|nr:hypothetical protein [Candidatus Hydrogenedentota bacterium]